MLQNVKKALANPEPSKWRNVGSESVFGRIAEVGLRGGQVSF
jgi:hypothetical protein